MDKGFTALPLFCFGFENFEVSTHKVFNRMLLEFLNLFYVIRAHICVYNGIRTVMDFSWIFGIK